LIIVDLNTYKHLNTDWSLSDEGNSFVHSLMKISYRGETVVTRLNSDLAPRSRL